MPRDPQPTPPKDPAAWVTQLAFYGGLAVVIARATILETTRDASAIAGAPRGAGAGVGVVLDLLAFLPALLVLGRRVVDRTYVVRGSWALGLGGALGLWTLLSVWWAGDKFAAAVDGFHLAAALGLLWAMSQLVRSGLRARIVAGVCFGLLLVFVANALIYRYADQPETAKFFNDHKAELLRQRGLEPGSYAADRFEQKVNAAEVFGFSASPNSFAAVAVLVGIVSAGLGLQRWRDGDEWGWPGAIAFGVVLALPLLVWTQSKAAAVAAVLAAVALYFVVKRGDRLAEKRRPLYLAGLVGFAGLVAAIVGLGLATGGLLVRTLSFRWQYWAGGFGAWREHPILGVGWSNFGGAYLAHRLPAAPEEPRDPHDLFVRFFVELGLVGGLIGLAWALRLLWELTSPAARTATAGGAKSAGARWGDLAFLALALFGGVALNALASIDFAQTSDFWIYEGIKRGLFLALLAVGTAVGVAASRERLALDNRPAPLLLAAMFIAVVLFLVQNLVDFSLFETGPMFVFALVAGSLLGVRLPAAAGRRSRTPLAVVAFAIAGLAWVAAGFAFAWPTVAAGQRAAAADAEMAANRPNDAAGDYLSAFETAPFADGQLALSAARAKLAAGDPPRSAEPLLALAAAADPTNSRYPLEQARLQLALPKGVRDNALVIARYDAALRRDPINVAMRLEYADALRSLGKPEEAKGQDRLALKYDDELPPGEPKRLVPERVEAIKNRSK